MVRPCCRRYCGGADRAPTAAVAGTCALPLAHPAKTREEQITSEGNRMKDKKLTFTESLMLVAGAGIGTGILTIPYAIAKIGLLGTLAALALAYAASAVLYLMIADLTRNSERSEDLIGILDEHLFGGKHRKVLRAVFFAVLVLLLLENLIVYILCASDVLCDLLGLGGILSKGIFYLLASVAVLFGMKGIGIGEKFSVWMIGAAVAILTALSCLDVKGSIQPGFGAWDGVFAVYGLFMFAFSAIFSVIQVCNHIAKPQLAGRAVIGGLTLNALLTLLFSLAVLLGSEEVTEVATIGLADSIGIPFVRVLCAVLVLLAMLSSFWSSGFAFADVLSAQLGLNKKLSWLAATLPAVLIAVVFPLTVLDYVQIGAGALSVILVLVVLPAYRNATRKATGTLSFGRLAGSRWLIISAAVAICLMAASSFVPIT